MEATVSQTPRLERTASGGIVVGKWGRISGHLLRVGDRLVLGPRASDELLVLIPKGYGRPMLGRFGQQGLVAEPSGVPASGLRWQIAGSVKAVERDLERGGVGAGATYVACRVEGGDLVSLARARSVFSDGPRSERELIHLCSQAVVAPEQLGVRVAIAAASDPEVAEALLAGVPAGSIRFALPKLSTEDQSHGLVVPGPWLVHSRNEEPAEAYVEPVFRREVGSCDSQDESPQLSLFNQRITA